MLGEPALVKIARELVETVKENVTIDWTVRENVRAQLRVIVKRILRASTAIRQTDRKRQRRRC
jgi:type I restriction enzyme R subunit